LIHFREEQSALKLLKSLGVDILHLRDPDKLFQKGEELVFDGFIVSESNVADSEELSDKNKNEPAENEDRRVFYPHREEGKLSFHTSDRFYATTTEPLAEGLCGAPVLDADGDLCGTVEGIVPVGHKDPRLAGSAAFIPAYVMQAFVDSVERWLVEQMMPEEMFRMVSDIKAGNGAGPLKVDGKRDEVDWEEVYDSALETLRKRVPKEEYDEIVKKLKVDGKEVMEVFDKEGS
jgi:hypothetical protein